MLHSHRNIRIAGTGSCVPSRILSSEELAAQVGTDPSWIQDNLGFRERRIVEPGQFSSDLATQAAAKALESAGVDPQHVDCIIVATSTPDRQAPSTACLVQHKLGITNHCPAFDLQAVCSGFLYALSVGAQFLQGGSYNNVLVIGADTFSRITDWKRRDCVFFGDGAGAVVLQRTHHERSLFSFELFADGRGQDNFTVYPDQDTFTMQGRQVYETATSVLPQTIRQLLDKHRLQPQDITWVIPHQPSLRVLKKTAEILGWPWSKIRTNLEHYANTAGATVPLLLDEVYRQGDIKPGDLILFAAVGSGWTWGAALHRWES